MSSKVLLLATGSSIAVSFIVVFVGAWASPRKKPSEVAMALAMTLALLGFGIWNYASFVSANTMFPVCGGVLLALGLAGFAAGFLVDRVRKRGDQLRKAEQQRNLLPLLIRLPLICGALGLCVAAPIWGQPPLQEIKAVIRVVSVTPKLDADEDQIKQMFTRPTIPPQLMAEEAKDIVSEWTLRKACEQSHLDFYFDEDWETVIEILQEKTDAEWIPGTVLIEIRGRDTDPKIAERIVEELVSARNGSLAGRRGRLHLDRSLLIRLSRWASHQEKPLRENLENLKSVSHTLEFHEAPKRNGSVWQKANHKLATGAMGGAALGLILAILITLRRKHPPSTSQPQNPEWE